MQYNSATKTYTLYLSEITKGIYSIIFKFNSYLKGITILQINYINMPDMLSKLNMNAPYDATYQAVKIVESYYDSSLLQMKHQVVVTTGTYHTILFSVLYGSNWAFIGQPTINKFFTRYAYYTVGN